MILQAACRCEDAEAAGSMPPPTRDMLDVILMGKRRAGEGWSRKLERQLCYELKTFLLAGHETSASMLTLTLLEVLSAPEIEARILQEASAVLGPPQSDKARPCILPCSSICCQKHPF
jgi:cytochrome P450